MFKKSEKNLLFVFSLCYNLLLLKFIVCDISILGVAAINAQQRHEVQRLKSGLSKADIDNIDVAAKGIIRQPTWAQVAENLMKTEMENVEVNTQNRKEAAALRAEIEQAVTKDNYATAGATKIRDIKAFEASLSIKEKGREELLAMIGEQSRPAASEEEHVGAGLNVSEEGSLKAPNIVIANIGDESEIDVRKLQRLEVSKRRIREVLLLKYIEEDFSFKYGAEVNEWKHMVHAGQEYFLGRRVTDLLIVRKEAAEYEQPIVMSIDHVITSIETYTYWNLEQQQQEGVILIAIEDKVLWYRVNPNTKQIELYWDWMVGSTIRALTYFTLDSKDYLIISSNQSNLGGRYALNIYQFKLDTKEFWIVQRLQLEFPFDDVTVLNTGRDIILAIPQNNIAAIYAFNPHEMDISHMRFELKRSVAADGISTIAGFKMGGHSYLALTGFQPQILLYQQGDFISKTILGDNFGFVELFFPIPVKTYRDDLILLVQHRVDFITHTLTVVETLIWDGESFETSIPVPCHVGNHLAYGVGCMLDLQRDEGLKGAILLRRENDIFVLVPRYKAESGLFRFHTELLAKNSELLDLQAIFDFLKGWVKEQDELIEQAQTFLQIPNEELIKYQPDLTRIETLRTPEFAFNGEVGEIYVNDYKWTAEDSNIDLEMVIQSIEDLEKTLNSGRQRRNLDEMLHEELIFDEVIVEDLELEKLNGDKFFVQDGRLDVQGLINMSELQVLDQLIDLQKREVNEEDFIFQGDLAFDKINGVDWSDIKENLIFKDRTQSLEELEVKGEVFVENRLTINTLNTLNFPEDFLLSNGPANSTVKAEKHFINTLSAGSVVTDGFINGKNPVDAITLTDDQKWQGMLTFQHLEVAEVLELRGQAHSGNEGTFLQNPTLEESSIINASCHFNNLIVNGPIILRGEMDDQPLASQLKDIVLRSQDPIEEILVTSPKAFDLISFPMDFQLENNTINKIPVEDFVTIHTEQVLNITSLEGYIYFYNLTLNGSYDGVKIEDVLKEIIFLNRSIDLSTTELVFDGDLNASSISILDTINKQTIKGNLQTLQEDLNINTAEFENLQTQQADFFHDILGQGKLNDIELHSFIKDRSWHEPPIKGNIFLNELILEQGVQTDELHGIKAEFLLDFLSRTDELPDMVLNGRIHIDRITVTGDVQVHKLNGLLFDEEIQLTTIKLKHPNFLSTNLTFKNPLAVEGQLNIVGNFRGNYLPDVIDDIVIRTTNSCVNINAPKSFVSPVEVLKNTQVKALNGIPMENMAWKSKRNNFKGSVHLKGNLIVRHIKLQGNINDFNWQDVHRLLYYDENFQSFVLKNTIEFKNPLYLDDLTVMGDLNDVNNLSDFFTNLIYKDQSCLLKNKNTFIGRVSINNGAYIRNLNGRDLTYFLNNLVYINGPQPVVIQGPVTFKGSVRANEMIVEKSLSVENLNGCIIKEWLSNSLRVDQDQNISHILQFAAGSLDHNSLSVNFINDKDLSRIVTLNTPQNFNETVRFSNIVLNGFIISNGLVNNLDLEMEYKNTLMTYGQQHIFTPLNVQTIVVLGDLDVQGVVNDNKNLQDVATVQEDLVLQSPIYFQSIYSSQVIVEELVTGIDFNKWFEFAVMNQHPDTQYITGNWSAKYLTVRKALDDFQYLINGNKPSQYFSYTRSAKADDEDKTYVVKEICQLLKQIWQDMAKKPAFIKYIEECFNMDLGKELRDAKESLSNIFYLKSNQQHLLLINLKCNSLIYEWLDEENKFVFKNSFKSGLIDEIEVIPAFRNTTKMEFVTHFVSTEPIKCSSSKTTTKWRVENDSIVLDKALPEASDLLYVTQGSNSSFWILHNETLQEIDLHYKIKRRWQLPVEQNKTRYRFVPLGEEQEILLTNGEQLVLISEHLINKSKTLFNTKKPQFFQSFHFENLKDSNSESLLKPNLTLANSFVFADFKQVIQRILYDLHQRLNQQVNITQLSIPESDLFDDHLVPDFLAAMEELQKQKIYPPEMFNISFAKIMVPETPSQILAARVAQISWPVAVEINKIHSYLKSNQTHDHPLCVYISKSLGFLINDVLMLANKSNHTQEYTSELSGVIQRIRTFGKDLQSFIKALEDYEEMGISKTKFENEQFGQSPSNQEVRIFSQNQNDLNFLENSHLPGYKQGEILSVLVGSTSNPRRLWAVTNSKTALAGSINPGIYLYLEGLNGQLYQVVSAIQPRSLQQLRIKQETLLLYIQECCLVKILKYAGSQGFKYFSEIQSKEYVKKILTISLPSKQKNFTHLIVLLLEKDIKFYEFVVEGYDSINFSASNHIPLDCL